MDFPLAGSTGLSINTQVTKARVAGTPHFKTYLTGLLGILTLPPACPLYLIIVSSPKIFCSGLKLRKNILSTTSNTGLILLAKPLLVVCALSYDLKIRPKLPKHRVCDMTFLRQLFLSATLGEALQF